MRILGRIGHAMFNPVMNLNALRFKLLLLITVILGLSGCNLPLGTDQPDFDPTGFAQTVENQLTLIAGTAAATLDINQTQPAVTPTPVIILRTPQASGTLDPALTLTVDIPCDRAAAAAMLDVTYPDDSRLLPGQVFTKIWRLVNRGSCTWNRDYQVVWFSGDRLSSAVQQPLPGTVRPGESVDIAVDMTAPQEPGLYTSFWMLRNPQGQWMGIGPTGTSPFWVRIQVIAAYTPTPTVTPSLTLTPPVQSSGSVMLAVGEGYDLDNGMPASDESADVLLAMTEEGQFILQLFNSTAMALYGETQPLINECRSAAMSDQAVRLQDLAADRFLCYRTGSGLTGWLKLEQIPLPTLPLVFEYLTWAQP